MFNEVFFDDVFVPDDCLVGAGHGGWRLARTTLANERVSMSSGATFGTGSSRCWRGRPVGATRPASPPSLADGWAVCWPRPSRSPCWASGSTLRALAGVDPGAGASVRKLLGVEHEQRVQEVGMSLLGPTARSPTGRRRRSERGFLSTRCLTIAGGTSEVQRNVIAERILGLPQGSRAGHLRTGLPGPASGRTGSARRVARRLTPMS